MDDFFQYSLNFTDFKLSTEEKLKFEQILVQNLINSGFLKEKYWFSWQIDEFLKDWLEL